MKLFKEKTSKQALLSVLLFIVIIALYIEINVLVDKINIKDIDLTESKLYSISEESKAKILNINQNVEIKLVDFDEYMGYVSINDAVRIINQYHDINDKITIKETVSDNADITKSKYPYISISCGNKNTEIIVDDLFLYKYSTDTCTDEEYYIAEEVLTNLIVNVTKENTEKVYLYTEKIAYSDESKYIATLTNRIKNLGNDIDILELAKKLEVPEDCNCIIIPPLSEDFSEEEKASIVRFIQKGGNIMFLQESKSLANYETPNLDYIMGLYGFNISNGVIMGKNNIIQNNPGFITANINTNNDVYKTVNSKSKLCVIDAGKINIENNEKLQELGVKHQILASAPQDSYIRTDMNNTSKEVSEDDKAEENAILGLCAIKKIGENQSKAIVYSNSLFATDQAILVQDIVTNKNVPVELICINDNEEIIANSIKYITENSDTIINRKKHFDSVPSVSLLKDGITLKLIFVIPMIIVIIGYVVWRHRKNKK